MKNIKIDLIIKNNEEINSYKNIDANIKNNDLAFMIDDEKYKFNISKDIIFKK